MNDGQKIDRSERGIRFGCGLLAGLALGFALGARFASGFGVLVTLALGLFSAILAVAYGDRFWYGLMNLFSWLRW